MNRQDTIRLNRSIAELEALVKVHAVEFQKWDDVVQACDHSDKVYAYKMKNYHKGRAEAFTAAIAILKEAFEEALKEEE